MALVAAGFAQVLVPAANAGADELGHDVGMLCREGARGELHAIGVVAGRTDENGAHFSAGLPGEERLAGDENLLHVIWVGQKISDGERGRNLADVVQVIAADDVLEPYGPGLSGDGVAFEILEIVDGRVLVNHDGLRIVLHGGGHGEQGQSIGIPFENLVA